jgi:hypothetical protein
LYKRAYTGAKSGHNFSGSGSNQTEKSRIRVHNTGLKIKQFLKGVGANPGPQKAFLCPLKFKITISRLLKKVSERFLRISEQFHEKYA